MNNAKVQQILQLEERAQQIRNIAQERAKKIVLDAKAEAQKKWEESSLAAEQEACSIRKKAACESDATIIQQQSKQKITQKEALAKKNFNKAVEFVLAQLTLQE
ncbi:MAG TPA: hypothetical protein ENN32_03465 [Chloroflexi bacterium]|nr:hypothetical protein [Chloroflexota bacterium]